MKKTLAILFGTLLPMFAFAQAEGTVVDGQGTPLVGATVRWADTQVATMTDMEGRFSLPKYGKAHTMVTSLVGYKNDTTCSHMAPKPIVIRLQEHSTELSEAVVQGRKQTSMKLWTTAQNADMITAQGLKTAACCNLGESFVSSASVDVNYTDASTGAKQIKLLGLSGTYVQMLTENIPNFRTVAAPYGLGYVPGPWMQSIQVSKGITSVKQGYEAMTGQINIEYKKPQQQNPDWLSVNLYGNSKGRVEGNADATLRMKNEKWGTTFLVHYDKDLMAHDENNDAFQDMPRVQQVNFMNRWCYFADNYEFQVGARYLQEERKSGQQTSFKAFTGTDDPYKIDLQTKHVEGFMKNAYMFDDEHESNLALILSGTYHCQDNTFGKKMYDVDQTTGYASLMYEGEWTESHKLSVGASMNYDGYRRTPNAELLSAYPFHKRCHELVSGAYAQYAFSIFNEDETEGKFLIQPGIRVDYSSLWGAFVTPRLHMRYSPVSWFNLRASAGKGYRTSFTLDENNYILSSSRGIVMESDLSGHTETFREEDWNTGISLGFKPHIAEKELEISAEYYYTDFQHQAVIDMDRDAHKVYIYQLDGKSRSHVAQIEATYPFFKGFSTTLAFRYTDARTTYIAADGTKRLRERPLTSRYKALCSVQYKLPNNRWQFDATVSLNGPGRMPDSYTLADGSASWKDTYKAFPQLTAQVTYNIRKNLSIYVGGENLTNFRQKNPIVDASNPWGENFDPTMTWGPIDGWMLYAGLRFNLPR